MVEMSAAPKAASASEKFDTVRTFIHDHSVHIIDDEFYANWRDRMKMALLVYGHASKQLDDYPHMECSTRASLMRDMLKSLGYRTRSVVISAPSKNLASHTFLEAYNPDTKQWEVQDPDYDIYWGNPQTGTRASIIDVMNAPENFSPCGRDGVCAWNHTTREGTSAEILSLYLPIVTIIDKHAGERFTLYGHTVDPKATYTFNGKTGTFCETQKKNCKNGFSSVKDDLEKRKAAP